MAFVLQDAIYEIEKSRGLEPLKKLKKENLVQVAAHFGITTAAGATKLMVEEKPTVETAEVLKLKLEFECEEW